MALRPAALLLLLLLYRRPLARAGPGAPRGPREERVPYYVYPFDAFKVNRCCAVAPGLRPWMAGNGPVAEPKFAVDLMVLRDLFDPAPGSPPAGRAVAPGEAEVFVVPIACTKCLQIEGWRAQCPDGTQEEMVSDALERMTHMRPGLRNHLLLCTDFGHGSELFPPEVLVADIEGDHPPACDWRQPRASLATGYSTFAAVAQVEAGRGAARPASRPAPPSARQRRYTLSSFYTDRPYGLRRALTAQLAALKAPLRPDFHFARPTAQPGGGAAHGTPGPGAPQVPYANASAIMADSLAVLSVGGDTMSTDRIFNAFDLNVVPLLVSGGEDDRLRTFLPFPFDVPWDDVVLWVDSAAFLRDPLAAVAAVVDPLSPEDWQRRLDAVERYRPAVSWAWADSRATRNVLRAARRAVVHIKPSWAGNGRPAIYRAPPG